jgi:osmoprotectant transport system permease protein
MTPLRRARRARDPTSARSACVENRLFWLDWVRDNWSGVLQPALLEHVKLTLIAVAIGFAIALAAALVTHRFRLTEKPFVAFSAVVYTIPSLALFQLLVPVTGLTVTTVEVALVGYTLLILYRNVLEGLRGVPADVREAARGMGPGGRHLRVELLQRCRRSAAGLAGPLDDRARDRGCARHPAGPLAT